MISGKTILVTGGAGFVGSCLLKALSSDPSNKLISLDNYFTGTKDNHVPGVDYREGHTKDVQELVPEKPDLVFHLGEYARVEKSLDEPDVVWDLNSLGTFRILEFCRAHDVKLVYAGSSTKFGDGGLGRDQSPYAWTKATNTELVRNYGDWYGLPYAITYFYNVYGPGEICNGAYATVIGIFRQQHASGKAITVVSPGTQRRNFTHIDDIVSGLLLVGDRGRGDDYGLGAPQSYSILEVAEMFNGEIEMLPERGGNRMDAKLDTRRATNELNWKAERKLEDYIASVK